MTSQPDQGTPKPASKPRAGVPVWRVGKPDAVLAAAVDFARAAVEGIAPAEQIGQHLGAKSEGDRVVTHLFESRLAGYQGWQWYAVLTRNSRSKVITVNELGLLPSEDSILAPEWVPWAERVRPEDAQENEQDAEAPVVDADAQDTALAGFDDGAAVSDDGDASDDDEDSDDDSDAPEKPSGSAREVN
ncbi:hypothetical protein ASF98_16410 [Arthrobacter sp. Leaf337]|uniref:DUF3027 domain-containing protein n=1 Tax=Arthrobacter sp. Leaf337 TaxID=1736342 RepID=UPI000700AA85|nr:DUF3027 domain-containing protein [Arthrobacter sp. Leaf337]KQR81992.1 hypothetical protein ASF98_16410 [Arthrobacter sp. Leaf337]